MILELAEIYVQEGTGAQFEEGIKTSFASYITSSPGYIRHEIRRGIEDPHRYLLLITWTSVAAHEEFRASEVFPKHRALISPYFAKPPFVQHFDLVE